MKGDPGERFGPPFLPVHHADGPTDCPARIHDGSDRLQRGASGGDDVIDHDRPLSSDRASFDALARAVRFLFPPDEEPRKWSALLEAEGGYRGDDRVCAQRETSDGLGIKLPLFEKIEHDSRDQPRPLRVQRGPPAVEVITGCPPARKRELAALERQRDEKPFQPFSFGFRHELRPYCR